MTDEKKTTICMFGIPASVGDTVLYGDKEQSCSELHVGIVEGEGKYNRLSIRGKASGRLNERSPSQVLPLGQIMKDMPEYFI